MSCCGQKRAQWQPPVVKKELPTVGQELVVENPVSIYYRGKGSYLINGKITGNLYLFGDKEPRLQVDYRDAPFLLAESAVLSLE